MVMQTFVQNGPTIKEAIIIIITLFVIFMMHKDISTCIRYNHHSKKIFIKSFVFIAPSGLSVNCNLTPDIYVCL